MFRYSIAASYTDAYGESNLHVAKECFLSFRIGLGMPKYSPYKNQVNKVMGRIVSGGFIEKWHRNMNDKAEAMNRQVND